jgi:hypothetical protein
MGRLSELAGWAPIRVYRDGGTWMVDWCRLAGRRFTEPFFDETIGAALREPFNLAFRRQTTLDELGEMDAERGSLRPAGLIFHMSRCGSTLAGQMLAALENSVVLSEAGPIDSVLGSSCRDASISDDWRIERLRWIVSALGASAPGDPSRFVLKLDAWHALDLPLIRRAFPGVPWVFLYREPLEVLVSQGAGVSWLMSAVNAPRFAGLELAEAAALPRERYHAHVLGGISAAVLRSADPVRRLVNYAQLPNAGIDEIPRWFGFELSDQEREVMTMAARWNAKRPYEPFTPDAQEKRAAASAVVREAATALGPQYAQLEAARLTQERAI